MTMMFMPRERKKKKEFPSSAAAQNNGFLCSKIRQLITDYRRNLAEFTKDEKEILLLTKLEQMEHSEEETRQGKRTCQCFNYSFQGHQICEASWRFINDIGELVTVTTVYSY